MPTHKQVARVVIPFFLYTFSFGTPALPFVPGENLQTPHFHRRQDLNLRPPTGSGQVLYQLSYVWAVCRLDCHTREAVCFGRLFLRTPRASALFKLRAVFSGHCHFLWGSPLSRNLPHSRARPCIWSEEAVVSRHALPVVPMATVWASALHLAYCPVCPPGSGYISFPLCCPNLHGQSCPCFPRDQIPPWAPS